MRTKLTFNNKKQILNKKLKFQFEKNNQKKFNLLLEMEFEEEDFESQFADQLEMMKEMEAEATQANMTSTAKPKAKTTEIMNEKENIYVPIKPPPIVDSQPKKRKGENSVLGTKNLDDLELNEIQDLSLNEANEFSQFESNLLGTKSPLII